MYIRESNFYSKTAKKSYTYHKLVETIATDKGPRQKLILNLGCLELDKKYWKELSKLIEAKLLGIQSLLSCENEQVIKLAEKITSKILTDKQNEEILTEKDSKKELEKIDTNSIEVTSCRSYGGEIVGYEYMNKIGLTKIIDSLKLSKREKQIIKALIISKLINPLSENATLEWLCKNSGLGEIIKIDFNEIGKDSIYRAGDKLLNFKTEIEKKLAKSEKQILNLEEKIILYDLTNTFLEGRGIRNDYAAHGKSKEKRADCPLISLGLAVDSQGYPKASKIFKGNQSEPKTVQEMINELAVENSQLKLFKSPNIIMDRGLATKGNIKWLKDNNYNYVVIERRNVLKEWEKEFVDSADFARIKSGAGCIYIKKQIIDGEQFLLCQSKGKSQKELSIINSKEKKIESELNKIKESLKKKTNTADNINTKLGRLQEKYIGFYNLYKITLESDDKLKITDINWKKNDLENEKILNAGRYVIKTNNMNLDDAEIWSIYMQLNKVEKAFRALKTDLHLRPIYHQTLKRTEAHIFLTILAYHILNCIEESFKNEEETNVSWNIMRLLLNTHQIVSINFIDENNRLNIIRKTTKPEEHHLEIYERLKINFSQLVIDNRKIICKM
ncbi:MAG: IS1634 family transposase [Spirochaetes bacterium]|nr:IS1634 family transposase [Spirochaetota bacterium]